MFLELLTLKCWAQIYLILIFWVHFNLWFEKYMEFNQPLCPSYFCWIRNTPWSWIKNLWPKLQNYPCLLLQHLAQFTCWEIKSNIRRTWNEHLLDLSAMPHAGKIVNTTGTRRRQHKSYFHFSRGFLRPRRHWGPRPKPLTAFSVPVPRSTRTLTATAPTHESELVLLSNQFLLDA